MNRFQLEKLYEVNGLTNYKLKTTDDLLKTHGVDFKKVAGYTRLDDLNKLLYEKFIVNLFNGLGLDSRMTMNPKGIFFVEDFDYAVKNPGDDYLTVVGGLVMTIDKNGLKTVHRSWKDDDYTHTHLVMIQGKTKTYLRYEYEHNEREEWLHVTDPRTWY